MSTYDVTKCSCTPAYYCPDENQVEPAHVCDYCAEYAYYEQHKTSSIAAVDQQTEDDLPF